MKAYLKKVTLFLVTVGMLGGYSARLLADMTKLEDIAFASLPSGSFEVKMNFSDVPPEPVGYSSDSPARIVVDMEGVESTLDEKKYALSFENAKSAVVLTSGDKTRLVLNLDHAASFETKVIGNSLSVIVNEGSSVATQSSFGSGSSYSSDASDSVLDIDFNRGEKSEGIVTLELANSNTNVDINQQGSDIVVQFYQTSLPEELDRRLDVMDFATPIKQVDSTYDGSTTKVVISATGDFDYSAYQADNRYVISVKPLTPEEIEEKSKYAFVGEKLSLNFQDIEVRSVLQLIADFTELNLVASDTVKGNITLRLDNVPWDQALDIVLKAKGLDKRQAGNVLMVAPAAEIAEQERLQVEANKQLQELAPLRTEFVRVKYADAKELFDLFDTGGNGGSGGGGGDNNATKSILSERGSAIVDQRTNTIILTDTEEKIAEFKRLIEQVDIPVKQVLIEARIVIANTDFKRELGVRWGAQGAEKHGDKYFGYGGSVDQFADPNNPVGVFNNPSPLPSSDTFLVNGNGLNVDLGATNPSGSLAFELLTDNTFIDLELSAMQNDGEGEIVSQPKILTGDKQTAHIKSGTEIAYQEATSSGATNVEFKEAVLKLEVTPQITPDNRIIMDLLVSQDSVGDIITGGEPSIDVTELKTKSLVADGQTLVLGGIFQQEKRDQVEKVPLFGDIPVLGHLFRNKVKSDEKREILIFITPKIVNDSLID